MGKLFDNMTSYIMEAMKTKDTVRVNALKNMKAKFLEYKTAKNAKPLDDSAELSIIKKMVKELTNDAELFKNNKRMDLATPALEEAAVLEGFLPEEASIDDISRVIDAYIAEEGDFDRKKMGIVIKYVKAELPNADGATISRCVLNHFEDN